jgi:hypothetical protein
VGFVNLDPQNAELQMAGGEFNMDYDQETTYFGAHCLSHDVVDILNMMADCALEPRSVTASSVILFNFSLINRLVKRKIKKAIIFKAISYKLKTFQMKFSELLTD